MFLLQSQDAFERASGRVVQYELLTHHDDYRPDARTFCRVAPIRSRLGFGMIRNLLFLEADIDGEEATAKTAGLLLRKRAPT
jgi:hypothetical protein